MKERQTPSLSLWLILQNQGCAPNLLHLGSQHLSSIKLIKSEAFLIWFCGMHIGPVLRFGEEHSKFYLEHLSDPLGEPGYKVEKKNYFHLSSCWLQIILHPTPRKSNKNVDIVCSKKHLNRGFLCPDASILHGSWLTPPFFFIKCHLTKDTYQALELSNSIIHMFASLFFLAYHQKTFYGCSMLIIFGLLPLH